MNPAFILDCVQIALLVNSAFEIKCPYLNLNIVSPAIV